MKYLLHITILFVAGLTLCIPTKSRAYKKQVPAVSFNIKKLDSLIDALDKNQKMMGTLSLAKNGRIIYNRAWGYRKNDKQGSALSDTVTKFRIGSVSKMFTAVMLLQLAEEHKVSLSDHLSAYFPEIPNASKITLEQMMNHHSGIYDFTDSLYFTYYTQPKTHQELISLFKQQSPSFEPGTKADYSNTNYVLLGYILEKVTGQSYAQNLQQRICKKLLLKNTYVGGKTNEAKNEAHSFVKAGDQWISGPETDMSIPGGAGCIVSTANDMARFIHALFTGKLINKSSLDQMTTIRDEYGLGCFPIPYRNRQALGHTGGIDEFHTSLGFFPEDSLVLAISSNGKDYSLTKTISGILDIYYNVPYQIPDLKDIILSEEILTAYEGVYISKELPIKITIQKQGGRLVAAGEGQTPLSLTTVSETSFKFAPAGIVIVFDKINGQQAQEFTLQQGGGTFHYTRE